MKKFLVAILAFVYLIASCGVVIQMHYCMGKLVSTGLSEKKKSCPLCGMEKKNGCCGDEQKIFKIDKQYDQTLSAFSFSTITFEDHNYSSINFNFQYFSVLIFNYPIINSPPGAGNVPLYISNCVYRV